MNLTSQLSSELRMLQKFKNSELNDNADITIIYKPTEIQQLHSEFVELREMFHKLREKQKWSEFIMEIDRKELQAFRMQISKEISELLHSVESIENRTIHQPKRLLVTLLGDEADEGEFSGSGEGPSTGSEPEAFNRKSEPEVPRNNWQFQLIEEIREIKDEQSRQRERQKLAKYSGEEIRKIFQLSQKMKHTTS